MESNETNLSVNPDNPVGICSQLKAWFLMMVACFNNSKNENSENSTYNSRNQNNRTNAQIKIPVKTLAYSK